MERKQFSTRRFETSDVDGIVELFTEVFQGNFSRKWWEWKYLWNPAGFQGEEGDVWIAETNDGKVVGHWGVIPERLKLGSKTVEVAQAVDAATHPDYQGQGIFKTLVKNVCSDTKERYSFVFGYPNELYKGYEKLGWQSQRLTEYLNFLNYRAPLESHFESKLTARFAELVLKMVRTWNLVTSTSHFDELSGDEVEIEEVEEFSKKIDVFWELVRSEHEIVLERDFHFLHWRFSENIGLYRKFITKSAKTGNITGYLVVKKTSIRGIQGVLDMVDLHVLPHEEKSFISLVKFAVELARDDRLNVLHCRIPPWHEHASFLRRLGFVPVGRAFEQAGLYQPRLIVYPLTGGKRVDFEKWFYTLADTDYA